MPPPERRPSRALRQLSAELAQLRSLAGMSQRALASTSGISQSKITRIERGVSVPDENETTSWLRATKASPETADRVDTLLRSAHAVSVSYEEAVAEAPDGHLQDIAATREAAATRLLAFQLAIVPGLLQTGAYVEAVLRRVGAGQDISTAVAARMRRQELLFDPTKTMKFVLAPRVLQWSPDGQAATIAGQRDRLKQLDDFEHISIGVLRDTSPAIPPFSNFTFYDTPEGPLVAIELQHGGLTLTNAGDAEIYRDAFRDIYDAATPIAEYLSAL